MVNSSSILHISNEGITTGLGKCFGTFGELLQGILPDPECHFLVTLPIARYSTARFIVLAEARDISVFPAHKHKSRLLAKRLLESFGIRTQGLLYIQSELREGKGLASSSADMVATALALQSTFDLSFSPEQLARIMASIEPSDGVMYPGIAVFYHREGLLRNYLGTLPQLTIVALDEGSQVDTVEFNRRPAVYNRAEQEIYAHLLETLIHAIAMRDLVTLGEISTRSAIMHQKRLPKAHIDLMLRLRQQYDALGVVIAHSGTCIGLLLDPGAPDYHRTLCALTSELQDYYPAMHVFHTHTFERGR